MNAPLTWWQAGRIEDIPRQGARRLCLHLAGQPLALFRTANDEIFALMDVCPHRQGPLSEGLIAGDTVTCPLHDWKISLRDGTALAPDVGTARCLPVRLMEGQILVGVPDGEGEANGLSPVHPNHRLGDVKLGRVMKLRQA